MSRELEHGGAPTTDAARLHLTVLREEAVDALEVRAGGHYADATLGLGGHTELLLERSGPDGRVLGVDRDPDALALARARLARFGDRATLVEGSFSSLPALAADAGFLPLDGIVADLGVSSIQLDRADRGFSFARRGPLDMRMGPSVGGDVGALLDTSTPESLAALLAEYGEVERPRRVADAILEARRAGTLVDTDTLRVAVERALGHGRPGKIHPATLVFQALRIAVNRELDELDALLAALPSLLKPGGRVAIISFHSLEDRRVKQAFRDADIAPELASLPIERPTGPLRAISRRAIVPGDDEVRDNPRARSAKLRVAERRIKEGT